MEKFIEQGYQSKSGVFEYLLVANPDQNVYNKVMLEKQFFTDRYKEKMAVKTKPHITVAHFHAMEPMEETCIKWIQRICSQYQSFTVALNNFSGFPAHTVYLRVQNPQPFRQLAKQFKVIENYVRSNDMPAAKLITTAHVTIAENLSEEIYSKAIIEYSHRDFHAEFFATELILLKRINQYYPCEKVMVFRFLPGQSNLLNLNNEQLVGG